MSSQQIWLFVGILAIIGLLNPRAGFAAILICALLALSPHLLDW